MADVLSHQHQNHGDEQAGELPVELGGLELRQTNDALSLNCLVNLGEIHLAANHGGDVANAHTQQDGQAADDALEQHRNQDDGAQGHQRGHRCHHEVVLGALRQVEANQRHNRTGYDRGHELGQPAGASELNNQTDQEQRHTRHDDTAEGTSGAVRVHGSRQGRNEREGGAQVGGDASAGNQQEQDRADTREEQGGCRGEAGNDRHEEGCTEHCDHVLRADADGNRPCEALVRGNKGTGLDAAAVAVDRPVKAEKLRDAQRELLR